MACTDADCRRDAEAQTHQVPARTPERFEGDVLQENGRRPDFFGDAGDVRPSPAGVVFSLLVAGDAPGLARESRSDEIHDSTPRATIEGGEVRPDRCLIQEAFFHARSQYCGDIGLPLDHADRAKASGSHKAESE
jgi:hypothetical protein